ncbi:MAG TPA: hypothetical protein VGA37_09255 [Gemmatimonadales bacterium]
MPFDGVPQGIINPPGQPAAGDGPEHAKAPGTLILVFVFLAAFVVYYFVNWKLLSFLWKVG